MVWVGQAVLAASAALPGRPGGPGGGAASVALAGQGASAVPVVRHSGQPEKARALPVRNIRASGRTAISTKRTSGPRRRASP
jgi:hypothetical protein